MYAIFAILAVALLVPMSAAKSKVLIVFAHQEPQSFNFAVRNRLFQTLLMKGHEVRMSNIVQMNMIQSIDRTDFTQLYDPTYFHPQKEQSEANKKGRTTFEKALRLEHDKVEWANIILFVFPYYVMYMPSIMKSWMERVFSWGFAYGDGRNLTGRKAMLIYSTGAGKQYLEKGIERAFWESVHGMFTFMGVAPLEPYCAYSIGTTTLAERRAYLAQVEKIASDIENRAPYKFAAEPAPVV